MEKGLGDEAKHRMVVLDSTARTLMASYKHGYTLHSQFVPPR